MWLLDVNLPNGLVRELVGYGIACDTTVRRGWREVTNGRLAKLAYQAGFRAILTRDHAFGESARKALRDHPELAVVIVTLSQARESAFLEAFRTRWTLRPIEPVAGAVVEWP